MFHMEHCVFAAFLSNGKDWRDCGQPCDHHKVELRDRVGATFPVTPDAGCRNTVFNAVLQSAAEYVPRTAGKDGSGTPSLESSETPRMGLSRRAVRFAAGLLVGRWASAGASVF